MSDGIKWLAEGGVGHCWHLWDSHTEDGCRECRCDVTLRELHSRSWRRRKMDEELEK